MTGIDTWEGDMRAERSRLEAFLAALREITAMKPGPARMGAIWEMGQNPDHARCIIALEAREKIFASRRQRG